MNTALVSGASRGIGRAVCMALAETGCSVAVNYAQSKEGAERTAHLCRERAAARGHAGLRFVTVGGDVSSPDECARVYQDAVASLGPIDILVNNAGITRDSLAMRMSLEDFDAVISVNLRAAFHLCKLVARDMVKQKAGRIINIASVVGLTGNAGQANYAASKAGLIGLTKSLAKELGSRSVTVNAVAPGFIETSMTEGLSEEARTRLMTTLALPRLGTPEDVAAAVSFLASDRASYITGQVIAVDGGMTM
ncbi:MAG: 3-oxoacyl-[acyl-carrier-protein] reductase [Coriobacteriales bacterium]|jgi:3-oxoacyl-[acyl-carrier protein] reductase|nr:3-oxoacyl-[acyl-carrier-protein] reductase [Coriobacteriales bacterium]